MIGIFDDSGARLGIGFNSVTLNDPSDPDSDRIEINTIAMVPNYDSSLESRPDKNGAEVDTVKRVYYVLRMEGVIRAPTIARLAERCRLVAAAFDPALLSQVTSPSTKGVLPLTFTHPEATAVPSQMNVRPRVAPLPPVSQYTGTSTFVTFELLVVDPCRFSQTQKTLTGAGTATNAGDATTWPTITITMSGAGSATYKVDSTSDSLTGLTLNLSGLSAGNVVTVDMQNKRIQVGGADRDDLYVSGDWFSLKPGNNTIAITNGTNATTQTAWRDAWVG